jgi:enterochelin esterase family protein
VLDGELYRDRVEAPAIVERLQQGGVAALTTFVYVSAEGGESRHRDFTCNAGYSSFLIDTLLPWIEQNVGRCERYYIAGLSLSGLAAAFAVLSHPEVFAGALSQSPSAWWNDEWLLSAIDSRRVVPGRFWISVGDEEQESGVSHPPSGLYQAVTQLDSVQRLAARLEESRATVHLNIYHGGHDPQHWRAELPAALQWLLTGNVVQ